MLSSWQQSAATNDAVSLQAQASLPSRFCSGGAGVGLPVSPGTFRTVYFWCAEHVSVQLALLKITRPSHRSLGVWEMGR